MRYHKSSRASVAELAKLQITLRQQGGPSENGSLFEQVLDLRDEILTSYGLPLTPDNERLLWFKEAPQDSEIEERLSHLQEAATEYLLSQGQTDEKVLSYAQQLEHDPFFVLPELKVPTHVYTLFVYNEILLRRKDSITNILQELRLVTNSDFLGLLGMLKQGTLENEIETVELMKASGLRYIEDFINF